MIIRVSPRDFWKGKINDRKISIPSFVKTESLPLRCVDVFLFIIYILFIEQIYTIRVMFTYVTVIVQS